MVVEQNGNVTLTKAELRQMIDTEARMRLEMTGDEFIKRFNEGTLHDTPAVRDVAMLLKLDS
ncbi:MAG: hypothetical protein IIA90_06660 [Chloroflexi bacterium]|nr:hypothetical protein [Chloroflexota bacterium]